MDKKTTMIAAIVVVVVIVIAAAAVVLTRNGGSSDPNESIASQLQIMGNANDDYTIDAAGRQIANAQ